MTASTHFSCNFVANYKHVFASLVVVFICLSSCLQKETNYHKQTCEIIDILKSIIFTNICLLFGPFLFLYFKVTDFGFVFSQWFFCKVSLALNTELNTECNMQGFGKIDFYHYELWGIGKLDTNLGKCSSLRLDTPSNLKTLDSVRFYKKLHVFVII